MIKKKKNHWIKKHNYAIKSHRCMKKSCDDEIRKKKSNLLPKSKKYYIKSHNYILKIEIMR